MWNFLPTNLMRSVRMILCIFCDGSEYQESYVKTHLWSQLKYSNTMDHISNNFLNYFLTKRNKENWVSMDLEKLKRPKVLPVNAYFILVHYINWFNKGFRVSYSRIENEFLSNNNIVLCDFSSFIRINSIFNHKQELMIKDGDSTK